MKIAYSTRATASGGRDGRAASEDGKLKVQLAIPKELGGPGGEGTNPEQLFAAGYSACFLGPRDDGKGFGLDVSLAVKLPGLDRAVAEDLVQRAHVVCPYSEATRKNLDVKLSLAD
jgi:organic hydroperoxide reductase OsmC/OhrA